MAKTMSRALTSQDVFFQFQKKKSGPASMGTDRKQIVVPSTRNAFRVLTALWRAGAKVVKFGVP